jgi:hypothetical protein
MEREESSLSFFFKAMATLWLLLFRPDNRLIHLTASTRAFLFVVGIRSIVVANSVVT